MAPTAAMALNGTARALMTFEGISVTLIVVLMVVIVVKLISGSAPNHQSINADVFKIPSGTSLSTIATAATFGFLSFAGFEGAASLGEETDNPRREIPRAIRAAVAGAPPPPADGSSTRSRVTPLSPTCWGARPLEPARPPGR